MSPHEASIYVPWAEGQTRSSCKPLHPGIHSRKLASTGSGPKIKKPKNHSDGAGPTGSVFLSSPHHYVGFLFFALHPPLRARRLHRLRRLRRLRLRRPPLITLLILHHPSYTTHLTPLILHHSSYTTHLTPLILHHSTHTTYISYTTHHTPPILHHSSYTTHLTPPI